MQWEVEQKFPVADLAAVHRQLAALGVKFGPQLAQADRYLSHPARDFVQTDEALRLRQVGNENFITYKGPKIDATTKTRREIELPLPPGLEIPERFLELLEALGFHRVASVSKLRQPGTLAWEGHPFHIALDDVQGVGTFLELETAADDRSLVASKSALQSLARHLGLGESERRSYLELLLRGIV